MRDEGRIRGKESGGVYSGGGDFVEMGCGVGSSNKPAVGSQVEASS